ncbi:MULTISPECIES: cell division protein FtsA [Niallia]|jgi:cell division protein FtsA|uniref:cell division protein FtsA n=1 Tax=Niallia TaxID=2837506 RepID=UPI0013CFAF5D|nr:cell division protein FtsA [Niallia circulans]NRG28566.1 cell division protein FtsA [Niallia circulans]QJX63449.1 cell division protein FtsA [Niallia circulans]
MQKHEKLFALDIGTRSVVGIILEKKEDNYHVADLLSIEHTERAMLDGQIHDVLAVSKIIKEIKDQLEIKHGPLERVSVAAAGRALKTERAAYEMNIERKPLITKEDILHMELTAVQQAQSTVAEKNERDKSQFYYCVGYSVLHYSLDDQAMGSLIDQQGSIAKVEIIATFLPKVVVESLIAALHRANLEMQALTLEPIAAINVLIPPSMRRLNVALVDIGAGTSDIAITDIGTVIAYGMVPVAGDEITEAISDAYLLDFPLAEKAKRELSQKDQISISDILGFTTELHKEEVIKEIEPALDKLADTICREILSLNNHKSPKAVMLVGGGSQTPALQQKMAEMLNLPSNRVAIRGIDAITHLTFEENFHLGPELVTPVGIAIAAEKSPVQYKTVYINEQPVRLFEVNKLTVGDCILASGIRMNQLYGKPGNAMIVTINNQKITIPGSHGEGPTILRKDVPCSLEDTVEDGETLTVYRGRDGEQAIVQIKDLLDAESDKEIKINNKSYTLHTKILCNGNPVSPEHLIADKDIIEYKADTTIQEALEGLHLTNLIEELRPFQLLINGKETVLPAFSGKVVKNGLPCRLNQLLSHKDEVILEKRKTPTVQELAERKQILMYQVLPVYFNDKKITLTKQLAQIQRRGQLLQMEDLLFSGDDIRIEQKPFEGFLFQDLFAFVDINMPQSGGGSFQLLRNGEQATFLTPIKKGDKLSIVWPAKTKSPSMNN